jgi:hypothetical protein
MQEPSLRTSRLAIAGGLAAVIVVGGLGFFLGRSAGPAPAEPVVISSPPPIPTPTQAARLLERADILAMAGQAADAFASGEPLPEAVRNMASRRFELALPFGCAGPAGDGGLDPLNWRYSEADQALRLYADPSSWSPADWGIAAGTPVEAIEGFWVARPWSSDPACPQRANAGPTGTEPVTLPGQTLAVAQFFTGNARRAGLRNGRPFESVQRVPVSDFDASRGFRLVLSGRIDRVPGGDPVRCIQPGGIDQRPICVVAVVLGEVRIENPVGNHVLASWPSSSD